MTRKRLLWRPGHDKKLSFECPEVMHEEKSSLHFSIIKQEAPEVGQPLEPLGRLFYAEIFVVILDFIFHLSLNLLITSLP